jgi:hypothetical protein
MVLIVVNPPHLRGKIFRPAGLPTIYIVNVARRAASSTWMECQLGNVGSDRQLGNNNERG